MIRCVMVLFILGVQRGEMSDRLERHRTLETQLRDSDFIISETGTWKLAYLQTAVHLPTVSKGALTSFLEPHTSSSCLARSCAR